MSAVPRLLFLPGAGADPMFWRPLGDLLPAAWEKRYFGWPGLGHQPPDPAVNSLDDLVGLVEAELGAAPVDILAQSMGGVVAMLVALRHPARVRRIVLTVTSGGIDVSALGGIDWRPDYARAHPNAATWIGEARLDLTHELARLDHPTLLIWGDRDPISPVAVGERLTQLLPNARLHVVAGADHDLVRTHSGEIATLIAEHLGNARTARSL